MSAVYDRFDLPGARHVADRFHWSDLARDVDLMRHQDQFGATGDPSFKCGCDLVEIPWWNWNLHQLYHQPFALFTLTQRCQHSRIILSGGEYLVSGFEIHSHQENLERFGSVARNRDLFAIATKHL